MKTDNRDADQQDESHALTARNNERPQAPQRPCTWATGQLRGRLQQQEPGEARAAATVTRLARLSGGTEAERLRARSRHGETQKPQQATARRELEGFTGSSGVVVSAPGAPADAGNWGPRTRPRVVASACPCNRRSLCGGQEESAATVCTPVALASARTTGAPRV